MLVHLHQTGGSKLQIFLKKTNAPESWLPWPSRHLEAEALHASICCPHSTEPHWRCATASTAAGEVGS